MLNKSRKKFPSGTENRMRKQSCANGKRKGKTKKIFAGRITSNKKNNTLHLSRSIEKETTPGSVWLTTAPLQRVQHLREEKTCRG